MWDTTIGLLFFLTLIALILDIIIFTDGDFLKDNIYDMSEAFYGAGNNSAASVASAATAATAANTGNGKASAGKATSYKDINDIILDKLRTMNL
jgi:hypothetical protein